MSNRGSGIYYSRAEYLYAYADYYREHRRFKSHKRYMRNRHIIIKASSLYRKKHQRKYTLWQIQWNKNHPDSVFNSQLKLRWNINLEQYTKLLRKQNGVCAICFKKETTVNRYDKSKCRRLTIDHCHKTGKIRGLLCNNCNQALGRLNDNRKVLKNAIQYLRK